MISTRALLFTSLFALVTCGDGAAVVVAEPPDPGVPCSTTIDCLNPRLCYLATAALPATWCASSPRPRAVLANCEGGYSAVAFSALGVSSKYYYRAGVLVAALNIYSAESSDVACGPDGMPFHPPRCELGMDLCSPERAADASPERAADAMSMAGEPLPDASGHTQ